MQLYLDSYGASLSVRNGMFRVKPRLHAERLIAVRQVRAIFITRGVHMTSDALLLALEHDVPVLLIDDIGHPLGQLWSGRFGSISTIRKHQALFSQHVAGWRWTAGVLKQKAERQKGVLLTLADALGDTRRLNRALAVIHHSINQFDRWQPASEFEPKLAGGLFRAWEGSATRQYLAVISAVLPPLYRFDGRSQRPALDPFNCLLNYLYGMLYAFVELALMKTGIDPYIGVLHADRYAQPTMVFDCIELYRHWADETAIALCLEQGLPPDAFERREDGGFWLAGPGKNIVIDAFLHYLQSPAPYGRNQMKRIHHIDNDAQKLATLLKKWSA